MSSILIPRRCSSISIIIPSEILSCGTIQINGKWKMYALSTTEERLKTWKIILLSWWGSGLRCFNSSRFVPTKIYYSCDWLGIIIFIHFKTLIAISLHVLYRNIMLYAKNGVIFLHVVHNYFPMISLNRKHIEYGQINSCISQFIRALWQYRIRIALK